MLAGSLSLREVVDAQSGYWWGFIPRWYIVPAAGRLHHLRDRGCRRDQPRAVRFPEAEQELVAGYNTEYSSVRFALFPQAEYINMTTMSAVATDLYLGGWHGPFSSAWGLGWVWFLIKVGIILFTYIWVRWTVPRYRLRPADAVRMEVAVPGVRAQSDRDRGARALFQCLRRSSSTCSRGSR